MNKSHFFAFIFLFSAIFLIFSGFYSKIFAQEQQATMGETSVLGKKSNEKSKNKIDVKKEEKPNIGLEKLNTKNLDLKNSEKKDVYSENNIFTNKNTNKNSKIEKNDKKTTKKHKNIAKKYKKQLKKYGLYQFRPFLDLNWLMVAIVLALFLGLVIGLWFLLIIIGALSLIQAILVGLSLAIAIWCFLILKTESDMPTALYDYFVRFGLFTFFMWSLLWVGLAGLFGVHVLLSGAISVGLFLGLTAFLVSLFLKKTFLHSRW